MNINLDSFTTTGGLTKYGYEVGTVEVDGQVRRAVRKNGMVDVYGYVGRYRTGHKAWPATVAKYADGRMHVYFGRDERTGRCRQMNAVSYQPEVFDELTNESFWVEA